MPRHTFTDAAGLFKLQVAKTCRGKVAVWDSSNPGRTMHIEPEVAVKFANALLTEALDAAEDIRNG